MTACSLKARFTCLVLILSFVSGTMTSAFAQTSAFKKVVPAKPKAEPVYSYGNEPGELKEPFLNWAPGANEDGMVSFYIIDSGINYYHPDVIQSIHSHKIPSIEVRIFTKELYTGGLFFEVLRHDPDKKFAPIGYELLDAAGYSKYTGRGINYQTYMASNAELAKNTKEMWGKDWWWRKVSSGAKTLGAVVILITALRIFHGVVGKGLKFIDEKSSAKAFYIKYPAKWVTSVLSIPTEIAGHAASFWRHPMALIMGITMAWEGLTSLTDYFGSQKDLDHALSLGERTFLMLLFSNIDERLEGGKLNEFSLQHHAQLDDLIKELQGIDESTKNTGRKKMEEAKPTAEQAAFVEGKENTSNIIPSETGLDFAWSTFKKYFTPADPAGQKGFLKFMSIDKDVAKKLREAQ